MNRLVLFISPISTHGSEGNHARLFSLVEAVRKLGYDTFLCLVDIPALNSQIPDKRFIEYWGTNYVYFKAGWRWNKSSWMLPLKGLFLVASQRLLGKLISKSNPIFRNFFDFQFKDQWVPKQFDSWFRQFSANHPVDAVICEYAFMAGTLDVNPVTYTRIIDTHDVFTNRNKKLNYKFNWVNFSGRQERELLNRADHVIAIQEEEAAFFRQQLGVRSIVNAIDIIMPASGDEPSMPASPVIGYLASRNPINIQAIDWFIAEIWPTILSRVPNARLQIAGSISKDLQNRAVNMDVLGYTEDLSSFYNGCNCIINPALAGTGLKIKTIEALMYGKPVVSTSEGASGLRQWDGCGFSVADTPGEFADACIRVLTDPALATSLSRAAKDFVNKRYEHNLALLNNIILNQQQLREN